MPENKIKTATGLCIVALTKFLMQKFSIPQEEAYKKLIATELYSLLLDSETNLFLEPNEYLCKCAEIEFDHGKEEMKNFICEL